MNILFLSKHGDGWGVAQKLAAEGDSIKFWIQEPAHKLEGKGFNGMAGFPESIEVWSDHVNWAHLILFDMVGMGKIADGLRKRKPVLAAGEIVDKIELDRELGQKIMKKYSTATIPHYVEMQDMKQGIEFLKKVGKPYVFKPNGNKFTSWTVVAKDDDTENEGPIQMMEAIGNRANEGFILQEKVQGIEISTEMWFNGTKPVPPFNHTIERKRFMNDDKGPNTGCMGNIVWATWGDKIIDTVLLPIVPFLAEHKYVGPIDINCIVSENAVNFIEITGRFGYDAIQTYLNLFQGEKKSNYLYGVATGTLEYCPYIPVDEYGIGIRLSMPPWPHSGDPKLLRELKGMQVLDYGYLPHIYVSDSYYNGKSIALAGCVVVVGTVVAKNSTIDGAREEVYEIIEKAVINQDVQYRTDIAAGDADSIRQLEDWGWL